MSCEEFREIEKLNCYLWRSLFGAKSSDYEPSPFELIEDDSKFLSKSTYSELRRQYLLYPSKMKGDLINYDDKMVKKILKKIKDQESNKAKKIKDKYYKKNLFYLKSDSSEDKKLHITSELGIFLQEKTACNEVLQLIWHYANGSEEFFDQLNVGHKDTFLRLRESLGLKSFDISQKLFFEYIYSEEMYKNTSKDTSGWGKVLRSFVDAYSEKS